MVRQVLSGNKPGANLATAAAQLAREGRITTPPERREQMVRAPGGTTTPGRRAVERTTTVEGGGRAQTTVRAPARGLGRDAAREAILDDLRAVRGGAKNRGGRRVTITVTSKAGNRWTLGGKGGYDPKAVARRIDDEGGDPFDWIADEAGALGICGSGPLVASNIATVTLTYF